MSTPEAITIVQARSGSQRLPGKVLAEISGRPALHYVLMRLRRSRLSPRVVLATTDQPRDDAVAQVGEAAGVPVFRGDEADVVGRFAACLAQHGPDAQVLVRGTGDNFLVCPEVIDRSIERLLTEELDLVNPFLDNTYPFGAGAEVARRSTFEQVVAATHGRADDTREHVFAHCYRNADGFRISGLDAPPAATMSELNISVDTPQDLERVRALMDGLSPEQITEISCEQIVSFFRAGSVLTQ